MRDAAASKGPGTGARRSRPLAFWSIAGLAASAGAVYAQTAPPAAPATPASSDSLQEVVVTAERRSENVQTVPIAITAFTADALQQRNLVSVNALGNLTPSVNLDAGSPFSGDRSVLSASIRGVGQDDFAFNLNPAVGVYLDGIYLARTIGANQDLLDVDRVEILKGPQGTLFGANTEGGAISIITHTPGNEEKFTAQVTTGSLNRRDFGFTMDLPLIKDTLLSSLTVSTQNRDGYQKVIPYPSNVPDGQTAFVVDPQDAYPKAGYQTGDAYGGYDVQTVRGKLLWLASDKDTVTLAADVNRQDQEALPYTILATYQGNLTTSTFSTLYNTCISSNAATINANVQSASALAPGVYAFPVGSSANAGFAGLCSSLRAHVPGVSTGGAALLGAGYVGGPPGPFNAANVAAGLPYLGSNSPRLYDDSAANQTGNIDTTYANGPDFADNNYFGFSLTEQHQFNDDLSLKSISGYRQITWSIGTDLDGTPETLQEVTDHQHQWQVSQEFQLNGKAFNDALNYVTGLYYFEEAGFVHDYVPFEALLYVDDIQNDANNKQAAFFVHADYKLSDQFSFTAGGRYTRVTEEFIGGQGDLNCFPYGSALCEAALGPGGFGLFPTPPGTPAGDTSAGTPGNQPYAFQYGGGVVDRYFPVGDNKQIWNVFDPTVAAQWHLSDDAMAYLSWGKGFKAGGWTTRLSANDTAAAAQFSPEYTKTWELGMKSEWFNHHLKANAALFYTDYDGIQLDIQQGISPVYTNAGNAKIKGAELELQSVVGGGLSLNFSGSYIDAYYTYVNPNANIPQEILPGIGLNECPTTAINPATGGPVCDIVAGNPLDARLPKTPKYKMTFYPEYTYLLANEAQLRFIVDFTYTAEMFNDSLNTPELRDPASRMLDASVHYISPSGMYDLALGGTNITDDRFITTGSPNIGAGELGGTYNEPAEWYLQLTAHFK
ncbi:MAG TPA: TonB-dependent receptor [Steroidobacteraceae bacterium]|jgi:iron complex outermembrane receptor protein|nr:TonB-dependent receptor [Steroidobacteraceae bacterium]